MRKMFIIAILVFDEQNDVQATERAGSQTRYIDKTEGFVFPKEPGSRFKVAFKHEWQDLISKFIQKSVPCTNIEK
jgi:hypothetical protein